MNFPVEFELQAEWRREQLLAEAEAERQARLARPARRSVVRARVAAMLYAVADWLCAEPCALETPLRVETA